MVPVKPVPEPPLFDQQARQPGLVWLAKNPDRARPHDYWTPFREDLRAGFNALCGYLAMFTSIGTIDHFRSWKTAPALAYEWSNYRFACSWINSVKQIDDVLDPYDVRPGWFEVILPSMQLIVTEEVPRKYHEKAQRTLSRLKLQDGEVALRLRREWYEAYLDGQITLSGLRKKAPLVAQAVEKQKKITAT